MRVLLEEARLLARDLAYHRRARLEAAIGQALEEVDRQIEELRAGQQGYGRVLKSRPSPPRWGPLARARNTSAGYYAQIQPGQRAGPLRGAKRSSPSVLHSRCGAGVTPDPHMARFLGTLFEGTSENPVQAKFREQPF